MRTFALVLTCLIPTAGSAGMLDRLGGTWDTLPLDKPTCVSNDYQHTITLSSDRQQLTFRHTKPIDGPDGKVQEYTYKVLYEDDDSATLYLEGETRKHSTGDRVIWVLILEQPDFYRWRIYGTPREWRNTIVGKRCTE